ncbi:helix-turn-helix domain-containing protein [Allokutzneria sp. A3M-2-11 16]|uniref:helix-turn-helix domain-containing protein n=1 Tax=Allokutzneria sp. A3M-2-11 16 TaxID=2962043 RepID=UPI0020B8700E|nr:helix-turn-helix domain-containing protein [Allokutzneria sp. A3M-2-11 16]MCP3804973.1 helix-turn-helix domain-containing protein [Allokutzneria sp. A3M-2-11 16]
MTQTGRSRELGALLRTGPFHAALRLAIKERGLTLERLRAHLRRHGVSIGLSSLSNWQHGHSRPGRADSEHVVRALEEVLFLPQLSLVTLLARATPQRLSEHVGPLGELLSEIDDTQPEHLAVLNRYNRVVIDEHGCFAHYLCRTAIRARRDGVDRFLVRYFGGEETVIDKVGVQALENCEIGRVRRHPGSPVMVAELLFGHTLRAGDTWVFEYRGVNSHPVRSTEFAHAFRYHEKQYVMEVRFHPDRRPTRCQSYERGDLYSPKRITGELKLNERNGVHVLVADGTSGVVGIQWEWDD